MVKKTRELWNQEFAAGKWKFLRNDAEQVRLRRVAQMVSKHVEGWGGVPLVDIGSGEGHLCNWLEKEVINQYLAVDISDVALENIVEAEIPVTRICQKLSDFSLEKEFKKLPLVIVANEVLTYGVDSVSQLKRVVDEQSERCVIIVSCVGPHPDKPNWTASSIHLWQEIDGLGWDRLESQRLTDNDSGIVWDIVAFAQTS